PPHTPHIAALFLAPLDAAHRAKRGVARLLRRHAPGDVFFDLPLNLIAYFLVLLATGPRRPVELGATIILARLPLSLDPTSLLQLAQRRVKRSVDYLQDVAGELFQAPPYRPAMERPRRQGPHDQEVQGALDQIGWFAHTPSLGYRVKNTDTSLGKQEE